jgi:hypothetical protein
MALGQRNLSLLNPHETGWLSGTPYAIRNTGRSRLYASFVRSKTLIVASKKIFRSTSERLRLFHFDKALCV